MQERDRGIATADDVARARERFLSRSVDADLNVRRIILASWQRSQENHIDVDRINVPYLHDHDSTTPLLRSATPILDTLHQQLQDEPVSIILTDHAGIVLDRRTTSHDLTGRLDAVSLAPGYSYAEEFAGTNGIGTAISSGQPALVDGREHYTHQLGQFACAGAPIHHPTRRNVVGILDLTSWAHAPGAMLMALASATARQIEEELLAQTDLREFALFQEYLKACQQSGGPVIAINNDVVMMNEQVRLLFDAGEQQSLLAYAADMLRADDRVMSRTVELQSGRSAHLKCASVFSQAGRAGTLVRVRLVQDTPRDMRQRIVAALSDQSFRVSLSAHHARCGADPRRQLVADAARRGRVQCGVGALRPAGQLVLRDRRVAGAGRRARYRQARPAARRPCTAQSHAELPDPGTAEARRHGRVAGRARRRGVRTRDDGRAGPRRPPRRPDG